MSAPSGSVVVRRWYESWVDGKLWCGSSDPAEVIEHTHDGVSGEVTWHVFVTYEQTFREKWEPFQ